jgi:hypothetical protein
MYQPGETCCGLIDTRLAGDALGYHTIVINVNGTGPAAMTMANDSEQAAQAAQTYLGVKFQVIPVSPANSITPLQIVCFFEWSRNTVMTGGSGELNDRLDGVLRVIREEHGFRGEEFESLLIVPRPNKVNPERILLFGLGDPETLSAERLTRIGRMAVFEATLAGVPAFAFAPDIRDAGVIFRGAEVSNLLITGMIDALRTQARLAVLGIAEPQRLKDITLLAGHEHLQTSQAGLEHAINAAAVSTPVAH